METRPPTRKNMYWLCSYRTYEEWKLTSHSLKRVDIVRSYRTYEEWKLFNPSFFVFPVLVLTVPMRNGNNHQVGVLDHISYRSYRTYEEWKPYWDTVLPQQVIRSYRTYEEWKRCENTGERWNNYRFLPYLWGMETSITETFISCAICVLTVPMRNGNSVTPFPLSKDLLSSYRTYEEWKLALKSSNI